MPSQKAMSIILLSLSGLMILDSIDFAHSIALLLLAGVVPFTGSIISPIDMMAAFATAFTVVILRLTVWPKIRNSFVVVEVKPKSSKRAVKQS